MEHTDDHDGGLSFTQAYLYLVGCGPKEVWSHHYPSRCGYVSIVAV